MHRQRIGIRRRYRTDAPLLTGKAARGRTGTVVRVARDKAAVGVTDFTAHLDALARICHRSAIGHDKVGTRIDTSVDDILKVSHNLRATDDRPEFECFFGWNGQRVDAGNRIDAGTFGRRSTEVDYDSTLVSLERPEQGAILIDRNRTLTI